jgi:hypothetical protein
MDNMKGQEEYVVTDRDKRLYRANKERRRTSARELTEEETNLFLTIVAEHRGSGELEVKLGLSRADAEEIKARLGIDLPQDARSLLNRRAEENIERTEAEMQKRRLAAKAEQRERQARQNAMDDQSRVLKVDDGNLQMSSQQAKSEWREREKRASREQVKAEESAWRLPRGEEFEIVDRFKTDILIRGMRFCVDKYGIEAKDIRAEAERLGLGIDWSLIHR